MQSKLEVLASTRIALTGRIIRKYFAYDTILYMILHLTYKLRLIYCPYLDTH